MVDHRASPNHGLEGELFVPFSTLPTAGVVQETAIGIRLRSIEGLPNIGMPKLSCGFRFGPLVSGDRLDKSKDVSVKTQVDLVKQSDGTWVPEKPSASFLRVVLPPSLLSLTAKGGMSCRIKVVTPGFIGSNAFVVSAPMSIPIEPGHVPLYSAKEQSKRVATALLSIGRLFLPEVQALMARSLAQQLVSQLRHPAGRASGQEEQMQAVLDALQPSRGWSAAAGVPQALSTSDSHGRTALRLAIDNEHSKYLVPLIKASCNPRNLAEDLRSPLTAALERSTAGRALFEVDPDLLGLTSQQLRLVRQLGEILGSGSSPKSSDGETAQQFDALTSELAQEFRPGRRAASTIASAYPGSSSNGHSRPQPPPPGSGSVPPFGGDEWCCDVFILALEHCPTGKSRRRFLCEEEVCAALWCVSLEKNIPSLASKLAVWIGLSLNSKSAESSRRKLLDVRLNSGVQDSVLARVLERAVEDERWLRVARVLVHVGAAGNSFMATGQPLLLFAQEQADKGKSGFRELLSPLLGKIGQDVDQWTHPTALLEDRNADCPICFETLWTSTPTAFVKIVESGSEISFHVICAHFFCFDCASQQYMKQQSQRVNEYFCPICRATAQEVMTLPDIAVNPQIWFQFLDVQRSGKIDQNTIVQAMEAMLPIDTENLHGAMADGCWSSCSKDGVVTETDFFMPGGLLEWIRGHQHELQRARDRGPSPPLTGGERDVWFKHWDNAKRGQLEKGEVLRALCEASNVSSLETKRVQKLKDGISAIWDRFAIDNGLTRLQCRNAAILEALEALV